MAAQSEPFIGDGPPPGLGKMQVMRWAAKNPPKDPRLSVGGKTVLITGSNTGLGFNAAVKFAAQGASLVILAVRTPAKGDAAKQQIIQATKCDPASIVVLPLDMSSFDSIRKFAELLKSRLSKTTLDIALLNAGVAPNKYVVEPTGWESALQVNNIGTAFLAILLVPILKQSTAIHGKPAQLTLTGSFGHLYVNPADLKLAPGESLLQKLNAPEFFDVEKSYMIIKLITMYIMQGLIDDYSQNENGAVDITINVACPGLCTTDLGRDFPWYIAIPNKLMLMYYGRSAEEGSRSLVSAALLGVKGHGKFWTNDTFANPGDMVVSPVGKELQSQAWKEIFEVCRAEMPN